MQTLSPGLSAHLQQEVTTLATCWKIIRGDGNSQGFTDHDADIEYDGMLYLASGGISASGVQSHASLQTDNLQVEGILNSDSITEADILAGAYDYAEVHIFQLNYTDVSQGQLWLKRGRLGEVSVFNGQFVAELRGLSQPLNQVIGELFSPACRAHFGDNRCKVNIESLRVSGVVSSIATSQSFTDASRVESAGTYTLGLLTFTGGANAGASCEVKSHEAGGKITLTLPVIYPIQVGDAYSLIPGCDKTAGTCSTRYNNIVNFRGEPHVPGTDKMLETAGTMTR